VLSLPFISNSADGPVHLQRTITRGDFEGLIAPFLPRLTSCCSEAIADAGMSLKEAGVILLVGGSTRVPAVQSAVKSYFAKEPSRTLNPDEAVAIGAAIQGAIMTGGLREVLLLDVTPLSLGIELVGGLFVVLIPRNSSIPTSHKRTFTTVKDNQSAVKIHVMQGERKIASENHSLAHFKLTGITMAPKEIPAIEVTFQIDANGILHVHAMDVTSGVSNAITVESYTSLAAEKADQAMSSAETGAEEDRAFVRMTFLRNQADSILSKAQEAERDGTEVFDRELLKSIREAAFRFDVAVSLRNMDDVERHFADLRELGGQLAAQLVVLKARYEAETVSDITKDGEDSVDEI